MRGMASAFADAGEVWAPRYRQATLGAFLATDRVTAGKAIDAAYRDVEQAFDAISAVVFVLGVELRRWHWAAGFALLWGAVMGLIVWHSAGYNLNGSPIEWPFWSGILAVLDRKSTRLNS